MSESTESPPPPPPPPMSLSTNFDVINSLDTKPVLAQLQSRIVAQTRSIPGIVALVPALNLSANELKPDVSSVYLFHGFGAVQVLGFFRMNAVFP